MNIYAITELLLSKKPVSELNLDRYVRLMNHAMKNPYEGEYSEEHHILPRSMFPDYASFSEHPWNKVKLSARQHFIAHWMLWRAFGNSSMTHAFHCMCYFHNEKTQDRYVCKSSRVFENLKIARAKVLSEEQKEFWTEDRRLKQSIKSTAIWAKEGFKEMMKGKRIKSWTEERRVNYSKRMKGENNPMYGRKRPDMMEVNNRPEVKEKKRIAMQSESYKNAIAKKSKENWEREEYRNRMKECAELRKTDEEFKKKLSVGIKKAYEENPELRAKASETHSHFTYYLTKKNGETSVAPNLRSWAKENGYGHRGLYAVLNGNRKTHKDIIKITKEPL